MGGKIQNRVFPLVAGAVLTVSVIVGGAVSAGHGQEEVAQQAELDGVVSQLERAQSAMREVANEGSVSGIGAEQARVSADTKTIGKLLERALTWDSNATYVEARESTMRTYGLAEDSPFMTAFLPPAPSNRDEQGNEYPYIDAAGLNSQVGDFKVKLLGLDGVDYSYMALVDVQAKSSDGLGTSVTVATVFVTIDGDAAPKAISGFASTSSPRTSG